MAFHWASLALAIAPGFASRAKAVPRQWVEIEYPILPPLANNEAIVADRGVDIEAVLDGEIARLTEWERQFLSALEYETGRNLSQWLDAIAQFPHRNAAIDYLRSDGEFTFRQAAWLTNIRANGGLPIYVQLPSIAGNQEPDTPALAPISASLAVQDFLAIVRADGNREMTFRQLSNQYHELGSKLGWPSLSDRGLSLHFKRQGCRKRVGNRLKDGSRPTIVAIPQERKRRAA